LRQKIDEVRQMTETKRQRSAQPVAAEAASLIENRDFGIPSQIQDVRSEDKKIGKRLTDDRGRMT
jgi:hypothetical protein